MFRIALIFLLLFTLTPQQDVQANTPTPLVDGRLYCPGSVALMYHRIVSTTVKVSGASGITSDIESFRTIIWYLVEAGYYFPTPEEFAEDLKNGVCRQKYAIVIIDDSWNDPGKMGVIRVLRAYGGGKNVEGAPKVWLGVVTNSITARNATLPDRITSWQKQGLVYPVSHSRTHPAELVEPTDPYNPANDPVYSKIASELSTSRKDMLKYLDTDPLLFVYPGGNVNHSILKKLPAAGYVGAFTVTPGGLHGAYPYLLPRINAGYGCDGDRENVTTCVIQKINDYSKVE